MFALLLTAGMTIDGSAQVNLGPHFGYDADFEEILIGAQLEFTLPGAPVTFHPGFDYYPGIAGTNLFIVDLDVHYGLNAPTVRPYIGGGIYMRSLSIDIPAFGSASDTAVGLNLKGGVKFGASPTMKPFAEARLRVGNGSQFILQGGLSFALSR